MAVVGHGVDLVEVPRIERMIAEHGERFIRRTYTEAEAEQARRNRPDAQGYAGRFAAKEAVMKALGTGWRRGVAFREIEVLQRDTGEPTVTLHGRTAEVARERGVARVWISISHVAAMAVASAVAVDEAG